MTSNEPSGRTRTGKRALLIMCAILAAGSVILLLLPRKKETQESAPEKAVAVTCLAVEPRDVDDTMVLPAELEARADVLLAAEKPGQVVEVLADKGDQVQAGQVLMRIDDRSWRTAATQASIELRDAERDMKRWEEMEKTGAVSVSELDAVRRRFELASAAYVQATVHVSQCEVTASIAGTVEERFFDPGENAKEGAPACRIVDDACLKLALDVPEQAIAAISRGQPIPFSVPAANGSVFTGRVVFVARAAHPGTRSYRIEADVDNASGKLKPGMIAAARVSRGLLRNSIVLPAGAVLPQEGEHVVYTVNGGQAIRRIVKIALILGEEIVLESGISAGDMVVVEGNRMLADGVSVVVK